MGPWQRIKTQMLRSWSAFILNPLFAKAFDSLSPVGLLGARGERSAERFLLRRGYTVVHRGYRDDFGEIDLVAIEDRTVVFVEVKTRTSDYAGNPYDAVDGNKQEKICRTALSYLKRYQLTDCRVRFDVVSIVWPTSGNSPQIEHFVNAFSATERSW